MDCGRRSLAYCLAGSALAFARFWKVPARGVRLTDELSPVQATEQSRVRGTSEIAVTRPSGSSAPWSSKTSAPLHSKVQPWPGCSVMLRAAHQSIASAAGHAGSWVHIMAVHSGYEEPAGSAPAVRYRDLFPAGAAGSGCRTAAKPTETSVLRSGRKVSGVAVPGSAGPVSETIVPRSAAAPESFLSRLSVMAEVLPWFFCAYMSHHLLHARMVPAGSCADSPGFPFPLQD